MKLYGNPFSCALASHIVIKELGLQVDYAWVNMSSKKTTDGEDYLTINPKGKVPALMLDDGEVLSEGVAVLCYLADMRPKANLAPASGTFARAQLLQWLSYIATELHKKIFYPTFAPYAPLEAKRFAASQIRSELDYLSNSLNGKTYLLGDQFTVADAYLITVLNWCAFARFDLAGHPPIQTYQKSVLAHAGVSSAMATEAALFEAHPELRPGAKT